MKNSAADIQRVAKEHILISERQAHTSICFSSWNDNKTCRKLALGLLSELKWFAANHNLFMARKNTLATP